MDPGPQPPARVGCSNSILISAEAPRAHAQSQGQGKLLINSGNKATLTTERWGGLSGCWVLCSRTVVVQSLSSVLLFSILWTAGRQASLSFTISGSLLKFMSIKSVMPSNHLILCRPFSSFQSFPASGSFPVSQFFASGGQGIGALASASVLPVNIQSGFPLGLTGWISLQYKGLSSVFSNSPVQKHQFFRAQPSLWSNSHIRT